MRFNPVKFILYYLLGTLPYAIVLTYLGSISDSNDPYPAVTGIAIVYLILYLLWYFKLKDNKKST